MFLFDQKTCLRYLILYIRIMFIILWAVKPLIVDSVKQKQMLICVVAFQVLFGRYRMKNENSGFV